MRIDLCCRPGSGVVVISVCPDALRPLGLHPDQPSSQVTGVSPPGWWHAEAERRGYWPGDREAPCRARRRVAWVTPE